MDELQTVLLKNEYNMLIYKVFLNEIAKIFNSSL